MFITEAKLKTLIQEELDSLLQEKYLNENLLGNIIKTLGIGAAALGFLAADVGSSQRGSPSSLDRAITNVGGTVLNAVSSLTRDESAQKAFKDYFDNAKKDNLLKRKLNTIKDHKFFSTLNDTKGNKLFELGKKVFDVTYNFQNQSQKAPSADPSGNFNSKLSSWAGGEGKRLKDKASEEASVTTLLRTSGNDRAKISLILGMLTEVDEQNLNQVLDTLSSSYRAPEQTPSQMNESKRKFRKV